MLFSWFKNRFTAVPAALCVLIIFSGCGGIEKLESTLRDRDVVIDGVANEDEWNSARYIYEDPDFTLGLMNDTEYIYLSLATSDQALVRKITSFGLTVWFNDTGKKDQAMGFLYPVGMRGGSMDLLSPGRGEHRQMDPEDMEKRMKSALLNCEIIVPGSEKAVRMPVNGASKYGIEASITVEQGLLVYELKVPLVISENTPYAVGTGESVTVGVGSITGAPDMKEMGQRKGGQGGRGGDMGGGGMGGGGMSGGMGGGGMGSGGRSGGGMGNRDTSMFTATEVWFRTKLIGISR